MRILDEDSDQSLNNITLLLTELEAKELLDGLQDLLKSDEPLHIHVPSTEYAKEITIALCSERYLPSFEARYQRLINEDK